MPHAPHTLRQLYVIPVRQGILLRSTTRCVCGRIEGRVKMVPFRQISRESTIEAHANLAANANGLCLNLPVLIPLTSALLRSDPITRRISSLVQPASVKLLIGQEELTFAHLYSSSSCRFLFSRSSSDPYQIYKFMLLERLQRRVRYQP